MTENMALRILELSKCIPVPQEDIDRAVNLLTKIYKELPKVQGTSVNIMYDNIIRKLTYALMVDFNESEIHTLSILLTKLELGDNLQPKEQKIIELYQQTLCLE